jgi:hypothetical protein
MLKKPILGFWTAKEFLRLVCDEDNNIIESLFYENVRGWEGYNQINGEIRETLKSEVRDRFVLMNNGVTIIAKSLLTTGHKFTMSDFQVVNGCQTSNVLYDNRELLTDESVRIPVRVICTTDDGVMESVITATNRQTAIKSDQFFALKDFAKKIEAYFRTFDVDARLYYERRAHQYDSEDIAKARIVPHESLVRSVGGMFLQEPHRTTRNYSQLSAKVGKDMFRDTDRVEIYYTAALALYKLENMFKSKKLENSFKPARYHILMAARLIMDDKPLPAWNSHDMGKRCEVMIKKISATSEDVLLMASDVVFNIVKGNLDRDYVRTEPVTNAILAKFGHKAVAA